MDNQLKTMSLTERAREAVTSAMATQDMNSMDVAIEILKVLWEKRESVRKFESALLEMEQVIENQGVTNGNWLLQTIKNALHNDKVDTNKDLCSCPDDEQEPMCFLRNWCHVCEKYI